MPFACCCYTIDQGYLLPTLLSAIQLRGQVAHDVADVLIVCIGGKTETTDMFAGLCASHDIGFKVVPATAIEAMHPMHARFFIDRFVDSTYDTVIYLDGDTQVAMSVEPLIKAALPAGNILAATDPSALMIRDLSPAWQAKRQYFLSIGLPDATLDQYFNSGVLRASRQDWAAIGKECVAIMKTRGEKFRFPDQDALNLCCGSRRLGMSLKWNFPIFLLNSGIQQSVQPVIYHFMSNPRPWQGSFAPWGRTWHAPYPQLIRRHPELAQVLRPLPVIRRIKYTLQQRYKQLTERRRYRMPDVQARIAAVERDAFV